MARKNMNIRKNTKASKTRLKHRCGLLCYPLGPCATVASSCAAQFSAGCWQAACRLPMRGLSDMRIVTKIS